MENIGGSNTYGKELALPPHFVENQFMNVLVFNVFLQGCARSKGHAKNQLQPDVPPQVLHFMQVPLRTNV